MGRRQKPSVAGPLTFSRNKQEQFDTRNDQGYATESIEAEERATRVSPLLGLSRASGTLKGGIPATSPVEAHARSGASFYDCFDAFFEV